MRLITIGLVFLSVIFLSGCVTTSKYKTDMDRLQSRIDELQLSIKQQEGDKVALKETQQQLEEALKKQAGVNESVRKDLDAAKKKLGSLNKRKSEEKGELKMPVAKEIQAALKNAGFYAGEIDGVIGPGTKEAVRKFQEANQLTPDGVVGSKTWALLAKYLEEK
jgi:outer membrane murein-binding lipoprotein Lpp